MAKLSDEQARLIVTRALKRFHNRSFQDHSEWFLPLERVGLQSEPHIVVFTEHLASELTIAHGSQFARPIEARAFELNPSKTLTDVVGEVQTVYNFGLKGDEIPPRK